MRERRNNLLPGLLGAVILHAGVAALALLVFPKETRELLVQSVPVTIIADATPTAPVNLPSPPEPAPPVPEPEPEPEPVVETPPPPPPTPTPPVKAPPKKLSPTPTPTPKKERPTPPRTKEAPTFDPDSFSESFTPKKRRTAPPAETPPPKKAGGAPTPGPISSAGRESLGIITRQLQENWLLNCNADGLARINPIVAFRIDDRGRLIGEPKLVDAQSDGAWMASARLAVAAVRATAPFRDVPAELVNRELRITFRAERACASR